MLLRHDCMSQPVVPLPMIPIKEYKLPVTWVREYVDENKIVYKLFRVDSTGQNITFYPGQFFMVGHESVKKPTGIPHTAAFSTSSSPEEAKEFIEFCFAIHEPDDYFSVSDFVAEKQKIGDEMTLKGPFGKFLLPPEFDEILLISSGSGIAPMMDYARHLIQTGCTKPIHFFFGFRNQNRYMYEEELDGYAKKYPNFHFTPIMSRPPAEWTGEKGYVQQIVAKNYKRDPSKKVYAYLCGNLEMCTEATELLIKGGFLEDEVKKEVY